MTVEQDRLVTENLGLVHACARRYMGRGIDYDDLYQSGCEGLVKAAAGYDSSRSVRFSTYAVPAILGEIRRLFRDGGFFVHMREWLEAGRQRGFNDLASASDAFEAYALSTFTGTLGVYATHDVYVAAYLHARGVRTDFCVANWPRFLDAAAIVLAPDGTRRYALVRAGLSDKCCGV